MKGIMFRKCLSTILILVMAASMLAGCSGDSGSTTAAQTTEGSTAATTEGDGETKNSGADTEEFTVGFSVLAMTAEFLIAMVQGAEDTADELGMKFILSDCNLDSTVQADQVSNFISQGVDAIVVEPLDADAIASVVKEANEEGIPVFTIDTTSSGGEIISYVASDNYEMGKMAAEYILEQLKARYGEYKGNVVNLMGSLTSTSGTLRSQGFKDVIDQYEGVNIIAEQSGELDVETALNVTMDILQAHSEIDAIWCSGDNNALGATQAIEQAGRFASMDSDDHIMIVTADGCSEILDAIRAEKVDACISQNPITMGEMTMQMVYEYLRNGTLPESDIVYCDLYTITYENIDSDATADYGLWADELR